MLRNKALNLKNCCPDCICNNQHSILLVKIKIKIAGSDKKYIW